MSTSPICISHSNPKYAAAVANAAAAAAKAIAKQAAAKARKLARAAMNKAKARLLIISPNVIRLMPIKKENINEDRIAVTLREFEEIFINEI